jgi:hypothetical protein
VWGFRYRGRLGLGGDEMDDTNSPTQPTLVKFLENSEGMAVSCGGSHSLFLVKNIKQNENNLNKN